MAVLREATPHHAWPYLSLRHVVGLHRCQQCSGLCFDIARVGPGCDDEVAKLPGLRMPGLIEQIENSAQLDSIQIEKLWHHLGQPV